MEEEKKLNNEKKGNKIVLGIIFIILAVICYLGGLYLGKQFANKEDESTNNEKQNNNTETKEDVQVNVEEMNDKLKSYYWILANFDNDYGTTVEYSDGSGSLSYLASMKDGDNLLDTNDKKVKFTLLFSPLVKLKDDQVCDTLNSTGCGTGNRAVKVDEFKEAYKKIFNEEVDLKNCQGNTVATVTNNCVLNNYLTYYEITGLYDPSYIKLFFNKLTKIGNVYTLIIDAKDLDTTGDAPSYKDNGKQIIVEYVKENDNISINSITYKKA